MSYPYWLGLSDSTGQHLFALDADVLNARAQALLPSVDDDQGAATAEAVSEALTLARGVLGWPVDWWAGDDYSQSLLSAPVHPDLLAAATEVHWQNGMPSLP